MDGLGKSSPNIRALLTERAALYDTIKEEHHGKACFKG